MKTKLLFNRPLNLLTASLILALTSPIQANEPAKPVTDNPARIALLDRGPIALDFAGGTLADLSIALGKLGDNACTIVGEKAHMETPIPPLSYRNATHAAIFNSLTVLIQPKGFKLSKSGTIATVYADQKPQQKKAESTPRLRTYSFPLGSLLSESLKYEDIRDTIRNAWDANPENNAEDLILRYHEKTQILIVVGPNQALEMAERILRTFPPKQPAKN